MFYKSKIIYLLFFLLTNTYILTTDNSLIVLLDNREEGWQIMSEDFASALNDEACPILVSAHIINHLKKPLLDTFTLPTEQEIPHILASYEPAQKALATKTMLYFMDYYKKIDDSWVIKEVNPELYLLIPHTYLKNKKIEIDAVKSVTQAATFTPIEELLGLKVNHMQTIKNVTSIKEIGSTGKLTDYFISSLEHIYLSNKEYRDKKDIPSHVVFMIGHGEMGYSICNLTLVDFEKYLQFLKTCKTKLFVYLSCYAAGTSHDLIYKDSKKGIHKTYNFPIITLAISEEVTYSAATSFKQEKEKIIFHSDSDLNCFVKKTTESEIIAYDEAIHCIDPSGINIPQILYPGLSWFSVLDLNVVVSIGGIMAKARTTPLDIARFFAKKGLPAAPKGLLLYTENIPFELIINTKDDAKNCYIPRFISMVSGYAIHILKKISSCATLEKILQAFHIEFGIEKLFLIHEISGEFNPAITTALGLEAHKSNTLTEVIISTGADSAEIYFMLHGDLYFLLQYDEYPKKATSEEIEKYKLLLEKAIPTPQKKITAQSMHELTNQAKDLFNAEQDFYMAYKNIVDFFEKMPNETLVHVPHLALTASALYLFDELYYKIFPKKEHKTLWFDSVTEPNDKEFKNIVITIKNGSFTFYYEDADSKKLQTQQGLSTLINDEFMTAVKKEYSYFEKNFTLDKAEEKKIEDIESHSIHQSLSADTIKKMHEKIKSQKIVTEKIPAAESQERGNYLSAIALGNLKEVKKILNKYPDFVKNKDVLRYAIEGKKMEMLVYFIEEKKVDPNLKDGNLEIPLLKIIKILASDPILSLNDRFLFAMANYLLDKGAALNEEIRLAALKLVQSIERSKKIGGFILLENRLSKKV